jgi:phosphatidylglycerophosphate synthase
MSEFRAVAQPPEIRARRSAEHWVADLYLRRLSPYLSRLLVRMGLSANAVTGLMIGCGWCVAAALLIPGPFGALLALVLGQLQLYHDCADGEVARWRRSFSPAGVFLDKVGHYTTESLIPVALGVRAAGGFARDYGWTTMGALLGLVIVLNKVLNDLVHVARAFAGLPRVADSPETARPRPGIVASLRRTARLLPIHRLYHSVELTILAVIAAAVDVAAGGALHGLAGTRIVVAVLLPLSALTVLGHFLAIMASSRLGNAAA